MLHGRGSRKSQLSRTSFVSCTRSSHGGFNTDGCSTGRGSRGEVLVESPCFSAGTLTTSAPPAWASRGGRAVRERGKAAQVRRCRDTHHLCPPGMGFEGRQRW